MIAQDVTDEKKTIDMYRQIIKVPREEADEMTALLFMDILEDEEDHHDTFTTLLKQVCRNMKRTDSYQSTSLLFLLPSRTFISLGFISLESLIASEIE
jgi:bacterioferritin (cytochrome b1)